MNASTGLPEPRLQPPSSGAAKKTRSQVQVPLVRMADSPSRRPDILSGRPDKNVRPTGAGRADPDFLEDSVYRRGSNAILQHRLNPRPALALTRHGFKMIRCEICIPIFAGASTMTRMHRWVLAGFSLSVALVLVATGSGQPPVPTKDIDKLIIQDGKYIQEELSKDKLTKKGKKKVQIATVMVAVYAHAASTKSNEQSMATLQHQAERVLKAVDDGKLEDARKAAKLLVPDLAADPSIKPLPLAPEKAVDLEALMRQFSSDKVGGFGMEKALEDLVEGKGIDFEKAANLANKTAMIAVVAGHSFAPAKDDGKKTKAAWLGFAKEMKAGALELAAAAHAKKEADVNKLADNLSKSCVNCHDVFRERHQLTRPLRLSRPYFAAGRGVPTVIGGGKGSSSGVKRSRIAWLCSNGSGRLKGKNGTMSSRWAVTGASAAATLASRLGSPSAARSACGTARIGSGMGFCTSAEGRLTSGPAGSSISSGSAGSLR